MSVELIDSTMIINFIEEREEFAFAVRCRFAELDIDQNSVLCYSEMLKEFQSLRLVETDFGNDVKTNPEVVANIYSSLLAKFDHNSDGVISLEEYMTETKKMMKDIANDIGFMPIQMVLEKDSLLMKAVELHHSASAAHTIDC
ncbi:uncharacterized protein LOC115717688 [Cannabis sativa]|nr:uncharacterized protein LOC115717688 [Cannabis sativa]